MVLAALSFLRAVMQRKHFVLGAVAVATLLGILYFATATRIYQSTASLLVIQTGSANTATMDLEGAGQGIMPTHAKLVTSAVVLEGAIARLQQLPAKMRVDFVSLPPSEWIRHLKDTISARSARRTNILDISYQSQDPEAAAAVLQAVIASYLEFIDANHKNVAAQIVTVLNEDRAEIEARLEEKEIELRDAKHRVGDYGFSEESQHMHPLVQRALKLHESLVEVEERRVQLEASLTAIRGALTRGTDLQPHLLALEPLVGREMILSALGLSPTDADLVTRVEEELLTSRAELTALHDHLGPAHPQVRQLTETIQNSEQFLGGMRNRLEQRVANDQNAQLGTMLQSMVQEELAKIWEHESRLRQEYSQADSDARGLNDRMVELQILDHDLKLLRKWHDVLVDKIADIDINQHRANVRVAVVSEPTITERPISPRLSVVGMFCLLFGLGGGAGIVYVMDVLDDRFRSPEDLQSQLGAPLLAMIRRLDPREGNRTEIIHVQSSPDAVESEAFRTLRTALALSGGESQRLVVTSAEPGDGKTTVLTNLGASIAQAGKKTLLIDGDLRRPGLTRLFDLRSRPGLANVLRGEEEVAEMCRQYLCESGVDGLDVLPCGPRPPDPPELLGGSRMVDLIAWAETAYDQVLIDTPPLLAASDAAVIGRLVDGAILVVQPEKNHRRLVSRAVQGLAATGATLVGIVANRIDGSKTAKYYGYSGGYGYGYGYGYGSGYGEDPENDGDSSTADSTGDPRTGQGPGEDSSSNPIVPRRAA